MSADGGMNIDDLLLPLIPEQTTGEDRDLDVARTIIGDEKVNELVAKFPEPDALILELVKHLPAVLPVTDEQKADIESLIRMMRTSCKGARGFWCLAKIGDEWNGVPGFIQNHAVANDSTANGELLTAMGSLAQHAHTNGYFSVGFFPRARAWRLWPTTGSSPSAASRAGAHGRTGAPPQYPVSARCCSAAASSRHS